MNSKKTGIAISSIMGFFWCIIGSITLTHTCRVATIAGAFVATGALLYANVSQSSALTKFNRNIFVLAMAFEIIGIAGAVWLLIAFREPTFIWSAVASIVGLHFIGLWLATDDRTYLGITIAMCGTGLVSALLPFPARMQVAGLASAMVLWLGAAQRLKRRPATA